MKIRAVEVPDRVKAKLDLAPEWERRMIVAKFSVDVAFEPKMRRMDWLNIAVGVLSVLANLYIVGRYDLQGIIWLNLLAGIVCALGVRNAIRRAWRRRRELEAFAAMAAYILSVYPPR